MELLEKPMEKNIFSRNPLLPDDMPFKRKPGRPKLFKIETESITKRPIGRPKSNISKELSEFSCDVCTKTFPFRSQIIRHIRSHTNERPYQCTLCENEKPHKSPNCSRLEPVRLWHPQLGYVVKLKIIGEGKELGKRKAAFFDAHLLKRHILSHTHVLPHPCHLCTKQFYTKSDLDKHIQVHNGGKPYKCLVCEEGFTYSKSLLRHKKVVHSGLNPYPCEVCDDSFPQLMELTQHIKTHAEYKPFQCEICDKKFAKSRSLREHYGLHTGLKLYHCKLCGKGFGYPGSLRKHH